MLLKILIFLLSLIIAFGGYGALLEPDHNDGKVDRGEIIEVQGSVVPEDLTFPGKIFTVLCREDNAWGKWEYEIAADEGDTELINEVVYKRNLEVENRFELEAIEAYVMPGQWAVQDDFINAFRNSILANGGSFDLIMSDQGYMTHSNLIDLYANFYDVPYVKDNLDAEYYNQDIIDEITVDGKLLYMVGDYSLTYWENAYVLYFNKLIAENKRIEDVYQLVRDGNWTFDKMTEFSKGAWVDLNGDTLPDVEDSFGYVSDIPNTTDAFWEFFDIQRTSRDGNGNIEINTDQAKVVSVVEKVVAFKKSDDSFFTYSSSSMMEDGNPCDKIFTEGRALFYPATLNLAETFREGEVDFGILPYPKWDTNQDKYYTCAKNDYSVAVIPIDVPNIEMSGAVFDVLSAISNETVIPAYYDMALRDKYARDDESGEMLDIIREGFSIDFAGFYALELDMGYEFRNLIENEDINYISYYAANSKAYERQLTQLLKAYEEY